MQTSPLIVFCHLRWDFVYQRPQHLLSRLAQHRPIIMVEEPIHDDAPEPFMERMSPQKNVTVFRPHTNRAEPGFSPAQIPILQSLVRQMIADEKLDHYSVWCYTAMAEPLVEAIAENADMVVFDVMDELSAFRGAPPELLELESRLLALADVVFTGGPSLYRAKKDRHNNIHCFSSSVDSAHFGSARPWSALEQKEEQRALPHPRLGFYGVIDERMDIELVDKMAAAHPEWQIVMVGPVVKIDPASLPRRPNIHYFGQQSYEDLPRFLAGWDVCLMPFAMNESTKFISPTKVLEYMAAERPIVSTPIRDVEEPYGDICYIGHDHAEFIAMCEQALAANNDEYQQRVARMRTVLRHTSWDATADAMHKLMVAAAQAKTRAASPAAHTEPTDERPDLFEVDDEEITTSVAIVGAGPTGLSAAYHLDDALLIDQNEHVGGWCRSVEDHGFTFDYAGHIMFSNDPYVHEMYKLLLGDNVHWQNREAWIYSKGVYTRYPFQGALYGLPPEVIKECVVGAIEARFGPLGKNAAEQASKKASAGQGALTHSAGLNAALRTNGHMRLVGRNPDRPVNGASASAKPSRSGASAGGAARTSAEDCITDCCADGIMGAGEHLSYREQGQRYTAQTGEPRNFEEFIYKVWGWGIAKHFAIPYNRKIWAVDLKDMETSWLGGRVPLPDLEQMISGALEPVGAPMGPNARFGYPLRGGFQALMDGFLPYISDRLMLDTRVVGVAPRERMLSLSDGRRVSYDYLISTMPLPVLIRMMGAEVPETVRQAAAGLRHTSVKCVNLGVRRAGVTDKHWIYYPEDTVFHRIFVQGNASPECNPPGCFGFTCEITYGPNKPLPCDGQELIDLCIADARRVGFIKDDDEVVCGNLVDMPYAYVIYDHQRKHNVSIIRTWLEQQNIVLAGRYSEWEYYNSDHAFIAGRKAAETIRHLRQPRTEPRLGRSPDSAERGWKSPSLSAESAERGSLKDEVA